MIEQIIASLITTLLGVIVGFFLSQAGTAKRDRETRKQQAESARILVTAEIDFNLELLGNFWEQLNKRDSDRDLPTYGEAMARKLAFISLPILSHKLWENQIAVLTVAMTKEQINQPLHFHQKIDSLVTLRARLVELVKQSPPEYPEYLFSNLSGTAGLAPTAFQKAAIPIWNDFFNITQDLRSQGNPLLHQ